MAEKMPHEFLLSGRHRGRRGGRESEYPHVGQQVQQIRQQASPDLEQVMAFIEDEQSRTTVDEIVDEGPTTRGQGVEQADVRFGGDGIV